LLCEYTGEIKRVSPGDDVSDYIEYILLSTTPAEGEWGLYSTVLANEARFICGIP
jgi:hypothetical protein